MTVFVDTKKCKRVRLDGNQGEVAEIVNRELCDAKDVLAMLRWLDAGETFTAEPMDDTHQLLYLMEGDGTITLNGGDHDVPKGAGIYLGPDETAAIRQRGTGTTKLLHLVVPRIHGR